VAQSKVHGAVRQLWQSGPVQEFLSTLHEHPETIPWTDEMPEPYFWIWVIGFVVSKYAVMDPAVTASMEGDPEFWHMVEATRAMFQPAEG